MRLFTALVLSSFFLSPLYYADDINLVDTNQTRIEEKSLLISDEDGMLDASEYLATKYGFMPVPILITEPAVGYGGGLALLFLHDTFASTAERKSPPSISAIMGAVTENGTWFGGAMHMGYWQEDTIRSTTAAMYMNVNSNFYMRDFPVDMNINGYVAYQELMFRLFKSNFFLGGNYLFANNKSKRNNDGSNPIDTIINRLFEQEFKLGGLAGIVQYDTRDTTFTPSEGLFAKATLRRFDENLGGNENFWRYGAKAFYFLPLGNPFVLGMRVEGEAVHTSGDDSVPFYANPSINMRGIPAMRYQGEKMALAELQLRWEFINRWNLVAFGGGGKVFGQENLIINQDLLQTTTSFQDADFHPAGGIGFRYELARKFGLWGGLDFATSEDQDLAFYITVGSAWGAF
jgi:hypothetical protein